MVFLSVLIAVGAICFCDGEPLPSLQQKLNNNFESSLANYVQDLTDQGDMQRRQGTTPSLSTGPDYDHTLGTDQGWYIYLEGSLGSAYSRARIISPNVTIDASQTVCLAFWYHMWGAHIGTLNVFFKDAATGALAMPVWSAHGKRNTQWHLGNVQLPAGRTFAVVFEAVKGISFQSDIALDDIAVSDTACQRMTLAGAQEAVSCTFEPGTCGWGQDRRTDQREWTRRRGNTPSGSTGPTVDHTLGTPLGYYVYLETTGGLPGHVARFVSSTIITPLSGEQWCFHFWYHMYGQHIGNLTVYFRDDVNGSIGEPVWRRQQQIGNVWMPATVALPQARTFAIVLEASRGTSFQGDIAVDDTSITTGPCVMPSTPAIPTTPLPTPAPTPPDHPSAARCDFELGNCFWRNDTSARLRWRRYRSATGSQGTGPVVDHTTETRYGWYVYLETSSGPSGASAILAGPTFTVTSPTCLRFWYHMFGDHIGNLSVHFRSPGEGLGSPAWSLSGEQGYMWKEGRIDMPTGIPLEVVFVAVKGLSFRGDIALDDINATTGACASIDQTTTASTPAPPTCPPVTPCVCTPPTTLTSSTASPSDRNTPQPQAGSAKKGTSVGTVVGPVVAIVVLGLIVAVIVILHRRRALQLPTSLSDMLGRRRESVSNPNFTIGYSPETAGTVDMQPTQLP